MRDWIEYLRANRARRLWLVIVDEPGRLEPHLTVAFAGGGAWVFGGIRLWNDLSFEDRSLDEQFNRVTRDLDSAVLAALVAATNSFAEPANA